MKTPFTSFDIQVADAAWRDIEVGNDRMKPPFTFY
jgi:hypothetical protein